MKASARGIYINLNTNVITVTPESDASAETGKGKLHIDDYTLQNLTLPSGSSPTVSVSIYKYDKAQNAFPESADKTIPLTSSDEDYSFSYSEFELDSGLYYAVFNVKATESENSIKSFTDMIGFVIRNGMTTKLNGTCSAYNIETSESEYLHHITNPEIPITGEGGNTVIHGPSTTTGGTTTTTVLNKLEDDKVHVIIPNTSTSSTDHTINRVNDSLTSQRITSPDTGTKSAINLSGTNLLMTKLNGNTGEESALVTTLNKDVYLTIFNNASIIRNSSTAYNESNLPTRTATFAILQDQNSNHTRNRRLQTNIDINGATLNVVGKGSDDKISDAGINFTGPDISHTNVHDGEKRQGAVNFIGKGGKVVFDGDVTVSGIAGASSWSTSLTKQGNNYTTAPTLSGELSTSVKLLNGARIEAISDSTSEKAPEQNYAYGICLLCKNTTGGKLSITLKGRDNNNKSKIYTTASGGNTSAGIMISDFSGTVDITLSYAEINATKGSGICLKNCSGTITITITDSTVTGTVNAITIDNCPKATINGKEIKSSVKTL